MKPYNHNKDYPLRDREKIFIYDEDLDLVKKEAYNADGSRKDDPSIWIAPTPCGDDEDCFACDWPGSRCNETHTTWRFTTEFQDRIFKEIRDLYLEGYWSYRDYNDALIAWNDRDKMLEFLSSSALTYRPDYVYSPEGKVFKLKINASLEE